MGLRYTGKREAYVDYYRPGFKLFCVSEGIGVRVLKGDCDMKGLYSIPKMTTGDKISYELPVERFAFFNPEVTVRDSLLFVEYNSRCGSKCSNTIRISEPLSLGPLNEGNASAYRAMEVTNEANTASHGRALPRRP